MQSAQTDVNVVTLSCCAQILLELKDENPRHSNYELLLWMIMLSGQRRWETKV